MVFALLPDGEQPDGRFGLRESLLFGGKHRLPLLSILSRNLSPRKLSESVHSRAVAEPRLGLEGLGLTLGSQYISLGLELARA
jgi:hypothetical protein